MQEILKSLQQLDGRLDRLFEFVKLSTSAEKVETVTGFVLGKRSSDAQPCLWMYGPEQLEFKLFTVWKESVPDTPFYGLVVSTSEDQGKHWPTSQPPTRGEAIDAGYFVPVECDAVFITDGTMNDNGRLRYKFDHWFDSTTEEQIRMPTPRPQLDYTKIRQQAAAATDDAEFARIAHPLYTSAIETPERLAKGVAYVCGRHPTDYRAVLIAIDMFADMLASGAGGDRAAQAGQAVYVATLNSLLDLEIAPAATPEPKQTPLLEADAVSAPVTYGD